MQIAKDMELALSPTAFFRAATGYEPDDWQKQVLESQSQKIAMMLSRQSGKTTVASALALWLALYDEVGETIVILAPSLRQSSEAVNAIATMYARLSGETVEPVVASSALRLKFRNGSRIVAMPGSADGDGSTIRGVNAVAILADEAARISNALINAARPFLATKGKRGRLVCMTTPWRRQGWFFDLWEKNDPAWLKVRADWTSNPRLDPAWIASERLEMGELSFRAEYMCEWLDDQSQLISDELLRAAVNNDYVPTQCR